MNEIGGYLEFEQLVSNEYYSNLIRLNSARNALYYVILAKKIKKLYIPSFLGDSISNFLEKREIEFSFYSVNEQLHPPLTLKLKEDEYLYVVNFYGQLTNARIHQLKVHYERIIVDNTQSFFQRPVQQVDTIYSCRKYFGVPDGAYLSTNSTLAIELKFNEVSNRMGHLLGRVEHGANEHYNDYKEAEKEIDEQQLMQMSPITANLLGALPYDSIVEKRNENYQFLHANLKEFNLLQFLIPYAPFCYPLFVKNAQKLRERLLEKKIYVPLYWQQVIDHQEAGEMEKLYALEILPLPCDQRYSPEQLTIIIDEIKEWRQIETGNLFENV